MQNNLFEFHNIRQLLMNIGKITSEQQART